MKPKLFLIPGVPTLENVDILFRELTGREPTPDDRAATEALYAEYLAAAPKPKPKSKRGGPERGRARAPFPDDQGS